ncbi:DsbA family protein [Cupriavidus sp. IDO]|uniref:DsbA family protein n=1 Tax=Cupriavidus sp. IDO TaxID=1539142 RepID=UPI0005796756|nr:DsbA family protein [Cupriavidus sp. IDO]KWR92011.1 disulfide bond formation protein DsbA [Cupriavidus sp. IDO]
MLEVAVTAADHAIGPDTARVTVVEYGDFECAYCQIAYGAMKILMEHYGPQVRFVYRHYPLTSWHPSAEAAAECAEAASAQDKFWPMYRMLYEHPYGLKPDALRQYAGMIGMDLGRYDSDMATHSFLQHVRADQQGGTRCHVRGTPSFFVNGAVQDVTFGMERLQMAIDTALAH